MLLFEARKTIGDRKCPTSYEHMSDPIMQMEADIMAVRCIKAQQILADTLNGFWNDVKEDDRFSAKAVYSLLHMCSIEARFDENGDYIEEEVDE